MLPWKSIIQIQKNGAPPVYLQIANAMIQEIKKGRIGPRIKLPGSRQMAEALGIHRKTIVRAYEELEAQGWIEVRPSQGTFTSGELPEVKPRGLFKETVDFGAYPATTGYPVPINTLIKTPANPMRQIIGFHEGPDPRLMPAYELTKAYRSVLSKRLNLRYASYVDTAGLERFRRILSEYLNHSRGLKTSFENIMVTRGGTMGLYLVVTTLFKKGDAVIVGDTNYYYADRTFLHAGMELIRVGVDDYGIDVEAIEKICQRRKISAVFITPHHHFPTTVTLSASRRMKLLSLAGSAGFVIIEDDYDYDFHYQSSPILPLISADNKGMVVYLGTLSKTISPAIRTGYVAAPVNLILELARIRQIIDTQGDPITELALADLFQDGTIKRTLKKALKEYQQRRDFVCNALSAQLSDKIDFKIPDGGLSIWAKFHPSVQLPSLSQRLKEKGVILSNGLIHNTASMSLNATRIGFGSMNEKEAEGAIAVLRSVIRTT
ncbi:MAG TPA: PLP-dependent aminotransferase family protein [Puia sp.]|nr:PLP-dependent aminotransferase family protein [Puia sp.]